MKLHLVLVALLPQALCAAMDTADLKESLQSPQLNAWIESIAARRQISKDAVLANIQAVTYHLDSDPGYHLDPNSTDPGSAGGAHPQLEGRQPEPDLPLVEYPLVYKLESRNDEVTNDRLSEYHRICRIGNDNPPGTPYKPKDHYHSFWRGFSGGCRSEKRVRVYCKLPGEFGPPYWSTTYRRNTHEKTYWCPVGYKCTRFNAYNYITEKDPVKWGTCTEDKETDEKTMVNSVPEYTGEMHCPLKPNGLGEWEVYANVLQEGAEIDWTLFTGTLNTPLFRSHAPDFLFVKKVAWRAKDHDYQPWLRFRSKGQKATVRIWSHLVL